MTKIVLIGGPSSGKTTLLNKLKERGFNIIPETAKDLIDLRRMQGEKVDPKDIPKYSILQNDITLEQIRREREMYHGELTFLDRGIYDNLAYCSKFLGFIPDITQKLIGEHLGYDRIFVLDRLPFIKEDFRVENSDEEASEIHKRIMQVYQNKGYKLERIPVLPIEERVNYLLEKVK